MKKKLSLATVQIQYELEHNENVWKLVRNEHYKQKIQSILNFLKGKVSCVVFPEFSIPFDMLADLKRYSDSEKTVIIAGSHYVEQKNIEHYRELFEYEFSDGYVRKSICPLIVPGQKIYHVEKINPSLEEDIGYDELGMRRGDIQGIFSLDEYSIGILICSDFLSPDLRSRILQKTNIVLVPQFNARMERFYRLADSEFHNPNNLLKLILLVNATGTSASGGSAIYMNHGKPHQNASKQKYGYEFASMVASKEEAILYLNVNMDYVSGRTPSVWTSQQHPVDYNEIPIIKKEKNINKILASIQKATDIKTCYAILNDSTNREILQNSSIILFKKSDISNLTLEEIKERFRAVLV